MKPESCQDADFVITGGPGDCYNDSLRCHSLTKNVGIMTTLISSMTKEASGFHQ